MESVEVHKLVEQRREARDGRRDKQPAWPQDSVRLLQRAVPVLSCGQVVERAHQEDYVNGLIRFLELSCVTDVRLDACRTGRLDVPANRINQAHVVPAFGEPVCVDAGPPPTSRTRQRVDGMKRSKSSSVRTSSSGPASS